MCIEIAVFQLFGLIGFFIIVKPQFLSVKYLFKFVIATRAFYSDRFEWRIFVFFHLFIFVHSVECKSSMADMLLCVRRKPFFLLHFAATAAAVAAAAAAIASKFETHVRDEHEWIQTATTITTTMTTNDDDDNGNVTQTQACLTFTYKANRPFIHPFIRTTKYSHSAPPYATHKLYIFHIWFCCYIFFVFICFLWFIFCIPLLHSSSSSFHTICIRAQ